LGSAGTGLLYPTLLDHDSPFALLDDGPWRSSGQKSYPDDDSTPVTVGRGSGRKKPPTDAGIHHKADALSYLLIGNQSLHLYFVLGKDYTARVPVAWFDADALTPDVPFPPLPPLPVNCSTVIVTGAGSQGVNGKYTREAHGTVPFYFVKDTDHQMYCLCSNKSSSASNKAHTASRSKAYKPSNKAYTASSHLSKASCTCKMAQYGNRSAVYYVAPGIEIAHSTELRVPSEGYGVGVSGTAPYPTLSCTK
jgi:hypothetical protein